jgi:hypothetical protein
MGLSEPAVSATQQFYIANIHNSKNPSHPPHQNKFANQMLEDFQMVSGASKSLLELHSALLYGK